MRPDQMRAAYLVPFQDGAAVHVLRGLDPADRDECVLTSPLMGDHYALHRCWASIPALPGSNHVVMSARTLRPCALFMANPTGVDGVASVALLARDHRKHWRELAELCLCLRSQLPVYAQKMGLHRIEVRCWEDHPTAPRLLRAMGFQIEGVLRGFGPEGQHRFIQFAMIISKQETQNVPPQEAQATAATCSA